jgi:hypothetical protein
MPKNKKYKLGKNDSIEEKKASKGFVKASKKMASAGTVASKGIRRILKENGTI